MSAPELTLYAGSKFVCPYTFHAMVALEEKQLAYRLEILPVPVPDSTKAMFAAKALLSTTPVFVHGDTWFTESLAISEYLAERFPTPGNPRIFPADLLERARSRQIMMWLRTSLAALRDERSTSNVFGREETKPLTAMGKADADELIRVASALVKPGATQMFGNWAIADVDLALALMRMIASNDPVPQHLVDYAVAQWERRSVKRWVAHVPTSRT